jgi:hypothetical protein
MRAPAACIAFALCVATPSFTQVVLEGHVLDDASQERLPGARVLLLNRYSKTVGYLVTDDSGHFRFTQRDHGWYRFEVAALGYQKVITPLLWWMEDHAYAALEVRLAPNAVLLAPLEIVALSPRQTSAILENAEHRRTRGFGIQITRKQIEERRPANVSDILVELPGVYAARRGSGASGRTISIGRALPAGAGGACAVQVYLDGMLATRDRPGGDVLVDDLVSPLDVEVIEVFRGLGSVPPEFLTPNARCGVIAIWTKRYSESQP